MDGENCGLIDLELVRELVVAATAAHSPGPLPKTVFIPEGFEEKEIPALHEIRLPDHIRQELTLVERESFTRYVKLYKGPTSQIFATVTAQGAKFVGVLDYHESGNERKPNHTLHVAQFNPEFSDEFKAWHSIDGKSLTQDQFLDHIRKWGYTIESHTDADMIEIVSNLEFKSDVQFLSKVERTTGGRKLAYSEVVQGSASSGSKQMVVPDSLGMESEIFAGGSKFNYGADLLYRPSGGQLKIIVELKRPHKVIKEAIDSLIADIKGETDIEPLIGTVVLP